MMYAPSRSLDGGRAVKDDGGGCSRRTRTYLVVVSTTDGPHIVYYYDYARKGDMIHDIILLCFTVCDINYTLCSPSFSLIVGEFIPILIIRIFMYTQEPYNFKFMVFFRPLRVQVTYGGIKLYLRTANFLFFNNIVNCLADDFFENLST